MHIFNLLCVWKIFYLSFACSHLFLYSTHWWGSSTHWLNNTILLTYLHMHALLQPRIQSATKVWNSETKCFTEKNSWLSFARAHRVKTIPCEIIVTCSLFLHPGIVYTHCFETVSRSSYTVRTAASDPSVARGAALCLTNWSCLCVIGKED